MLKNVALKRINGKKYGIDLLEPDIAISDVQYMIGDLTTTGLPSQYFKNITCLSVLEHQVDLNKFAVEVSRLLEIKGKLFVTFDYWEPQRVPTISLYNLTWLPFDQKKLTSLISCCREQGLELIQNFDWGLEQPVIHWGYYSPEPDNGIYFWNGCF